MCTTTLYKGVKDGAGKVHVPVFFRCTEWPESLRDDETGEDDYYDWSKECTIGEDGLKCP